MMVYESSMYRFHVRHCDDFLTILTISQEDSPSDICFANLFSSSARNCHAYNHSYFDGLASFDANAE